MSSWQHRLLWIRGRGLAIGENANIDGSNRNYILDERSSKTSFIPLNRGSVSQINEKSPNILEMLGACMICTAM